MEHGMFQFLPKQIIHVSSLNRNTNIFIHNQLIVSYITEKDYTFFICFTIFYFFLKLSLLTRTQYSLVCRYFSNKKKCFCVSVMIHSHANVHPFLLYTKQQKKNSAFLYPPIRQGVFIIDTFSHCGLCIQTQQVYFCEFLMLCIK